MTAERAVELCRALNPHTVIPVHYEGWTHFRQKPGNAEAVLNSASLGARVRWLAHGAATEIAV
jgi:L-ascorbate metabolism protein UlaG (beta-lactamase superfamily)